jgi:hypothetical protein
VPITPALKKRVQYTYVWATILRSKDLLILEIIFAKDGNAFLIGCDLKYLYNTFDIGAEDVFSPIYIYFSWFGNINPKLNLSRFKEDSYFGYNIYIKNPLITLNLSRCADRNRLVVPDLRKLINPTTL